MRDDDIATTLARVFLSTLDPTCHNWEFRTFDDDKARKDPELTRVLSGSLDEHLVALKRLNEKGAGVFVTVNETDGKGRRANNVTRVRAAFADTDGADVVPLLALLPHITVKTSPGRWHCYWLVRDCELRQFKALQKAIIEKFGTDWKVCDLPRVMRLPGFQHRKDAPHLVDLDRCRMDPNRAAYSVQEVVDGLALDLSKVGPSGNSVAASPTSFATRRSSPPPVDTMRAMLDHLVERSFFQDRTGVERDAQGRITKLGWIETGMALKLAYGDEGQELWAITHLDERAYDAAPGQWASFAVVSMPGQITIGTVIKAARDAGFVEVATVDEERPTGDGGDVANGRLFARMFRDRLLFIGDSGDWLQFDPASGWRSASFGEADRAAKEVLAALRDEAAEQVRVAIEHPRTKRLLRHAERTSQAPHLRAMVDMTKSEPGMFTSVRDLDADPMMLGVDNGVLDLRTGALLPVSPGLRVSKRCRVAFDPCAKSPLLERFLAEVQPDPSIREFLHRWVGYCLTGLVGEQVFVFLHGSGANGKSVLIELIAWVLGDYALKISTNLLMQQKRSSQAPDADLVALQGMRFVFANETEEGGRFSDSRVKELTGGDTLTGRVPYAKTAVTFKPNLKLAIAGNHRPQISDMSHGMWRRVLLVPFDTTIAEADRDQQLQRKLREEGSGILNWALAGLSAWQTEGLGAPVKIKAATSAYRDDQDVLNDFVTEQCDCGPGFSVEKDCLYPVYSTWCETNGHRIMSRNSLTRRLADRGYRLAPDKRRIEGLRLKTADAGPTAPLCVIA